MKLDESKCAYQTMSLFDAAPVMIPTVPVRTGGRAEIYFDGGCSPNPGTKYGSFQIKLNGKEIVKRLRVSFGHGTNNEAEFNALKLGLDEAIAWFESNTTDLQTLTLIVETDSMIVRNRLVVKNVIFKKYPSSQRMFALANDCLDLMKQFGKFEVVWKERAHNVERFGH